MDERGYLTITGRLKDMIIRGGENIYPREIEDVLFAHPACRRGGRVGVADETWGERVAAVIMPADPANPPSPGGAAGRTAGSAWPGSRPRPSGFSLRSIPLTASGKIQKFRLQDRHRGGPDHPGGRSSLRPAPPP